MNDKYLLIIDGSGLLSTQYYGNMPKQLLYAKTEEERSQYYDKLMKTSSGVYTNGVFGFLKSLFSIIRKQKPGYIAICWDKTRNTFRRKLYSEYKAQRSETPAPLKSQFALCQDVLDRMGFAQFSSDEYEADDYAGTLSRRFEKDLPVFIYTKDRDYLQLIDDRVTLWMMTSSRSKADAFYKAQGLDRAELIVPDNAIYLTPELCEKQYGFPPEKTVFFKELAGDSSDNIPGVEGIGEKTAMTLISAYDSDEDLFREITGKNSDELEVLKKRWKDDLGLKRSPVKYLADQTAAGTSGYEQARLSRELATIKRDIDLNTELEDLSYHLVKSDVDQVLKELEIHSLVVDDISGEDSSPALPERKMELIKADSASEIESSMDFNGENVCVQLECDEDYIYSMAWCAVGQNREYLADTSGALSSDDLAGALYSLYERSSALVCCDLKKILAFLPYSVTENLLSGEDSRANEDLSVASYLLDPLMSSYLPVDIGRNEGIDVKDIRPVLKKSTLADVCAADMEEVNRCCLSELELTVKARETLIKKLEASGMLKLYREIEMPTLYTLREMEKNGITVKRQALYDYSLELKSHIDTLEKSIYHMAGHEFNIQSPKQLGTVLFEELGIRPGKKTKSGYSTSAEVLEERQNEHPIIPAILDFRQYSKLYSTYGVGLQSFIRSDGRIHGHFNQMVTATGRISSNDPNLQNIPMRTELGRSIRKVFVPAEGYVFVDADYSQIELRVLAHMSGDSNLIEAYNTGEDIHAITAASVFKVPYDQVTPEMRRNAKAVNFGIVYGISAHGLAENIGVSYKEAKDYIDKYFETFPGIRTYLDSVVDEAYVQGSVSTAFGRIRPIPELKSGNGNMRNFGERVAKNSPIQGTAADIMKKAMISICRELSRRHLRSRLVLQIHDEVLVETEKSELKEVEEIVRQAMTGAADLKVPLVIDMNTGDNWYDAK